MSELGPLPKTDWILYMPDRRYEPGWLSCQEGYDADQMREYAAQEVAKERERWQKWTCRKEWESVNDPPCHPGDKGWRPCETCKGPNTEGKRPAQGTDAGPV